MFNVIVNAIIIIIFLILTKTHILCYHCGTVRLRCPDAGEKSRVSQQYDEAKRNQICYYIPIAQERLHVNMN